MLATSKNRQSGIVDALIVYLAGAGVIIAACAGLYLTGRSAGKEVAQKEWDAEKAAIVLKAEEQRKESVKVVANLVRANIDKDAEIDKLSADIKQKGIQNATKKLCPTAPDGSTLVTPERLRALKQLYSK